MAEKGFLAGVRGQQAPGGSRAKPWQGSGDGVSSVDGSHELCNLAFQVHPRVKALKARRRIPGSVSWADVVLEGARAAPWLWWGLALVVLIVLLLLGMRLLGLFPE